MIDKAWEKDKDRTALAKAVKSLPGFIAGNGCYTAPNAIKRKINVFSGYIVETLANGAKVNFGLMRKIVEAHGALGKLRPGCYLDTGDLSWELMSLVETDGFLYFSVKALSNDRIAELPPDWFRPADEETIKKKLEKRKSLHEEKPNGGVDEANAKIDLGGGDRPKFLNFLAESQEDIDAIRRDLDIAGFGGKIKPFLEEAWDAKSLLPWRLLFGSSVTVAKTEAGLIYAGKGSGNEKAFAELVEIGNSRVANWRLNKVVAQGDDAEKKSSSRSI